MRRAYDCWRFLCLTALISPDSQEASGPSPFLKYQCFLHCTTRFETGFDHDIRRVVACLTRVDLTQILPPAGIRFYCRRQYLFVPRPVEAKVYYYIVHSLPQLRNFLHRALMIRI